jgi:cysteinyl-tRNA synthetase
MGGESNEGKVEKYDEFRERFDGALALDLNVPQALAVAWEVAKSNLPPCDKRDLLLLFDEVLGLNFSGGREKRVEEEKVPGKILKLVEEREEARREKNWKMADEIRREIEKGGYVISDMETGVDVRRK